MSTLNISSEFQTLIPALTSDEFDALEKSIKNEGCRDALIVWNDTIIDGHNRHTICEKHSIDFTTIEKSFDSTDHAKKWIIENQLARRNLTPYQRSVLALQMEGLFRERARERQGTRTDIMETFPQCFEPVKTRDKIGKFAGVSGKTIDKVKKIEAQASPEQKEQLERGDVSINRVYEEVKVKERGGHVMSVMGSSESPEFYTPQNIINLTLKMFNGKINTDPCSNSKEAPAVPADLLFTKEDDGLRQSWEGSVYLNPPYGSEIPAWAETLINKYNYGEIIEAIALLPGRIDTAWFQPLYEHLICNVRGRIQFTNSSHSAPFPSVVVYLGKNRDRFVTVFKELGPIMRRVG